MAIDSRVGVRRDRHDRGLIGPLLPHNAPLHETPDQFFARQMEQAISDVEIRLNKKLTTITFGIEAVPSERDFVLSEGIIPLGRIERGNPSVVVVYQRPIEMRASDRLKLVRVLRDVLAELLARLLNLSTQDIDPDYIGPEIRE